MDRLGHIDPQSREALELAARAFALFEANRTVARINMGEASGNDGLVLAVARRYEHYFLTGEVTAPAAEPPPS